METILIKEAELDRDGNVVISYSDKFDKIEGSGYTNYNNLKIELHNENILGLVSKLAVLIKDIDWNMNDSQIQEYIIKEL